MAVWSEVKARSLASGFRLDAEYYQPTHQDTVRRLADIGAVQIATFAFVTDGIHASPDWVEEGGIRYLSAKSVKDNYFVLENAGQISLAQDAANPRTRAQLNDVLITTVGTIGNSAVVYEDVLPANMDRHLGIIRIKDPDIDPYYLSLFLNCHYGRLQSIRESTGNVQLNLFIDKINQLLVPVGEKYNQCGQMVREAYAKRKNSQLLYSQAEASLLEALNIDESTVSTETGYERDFSQVMRAERFDAEFFRPRNWELEERLLAAPHKRLKEIATVSSGFPWKSEYFLESSEEGEPFVRIRDCKPGQIDTETLSRLDSEYVLSCKINGKPIPQAQRGNIIIGMDGVDYFYGGLIQSPCYVNQRACRVAPFDSSLPSEYLMVVINSTLGQSQLLRRMTIAQTVGHITNEDVRALIIPTHDALVEEVTKKVRDSFQAKTDAQNLLEEAKTRVETLIAEGV